MDEIVRAFDWTVLKDVADTLTGFGTVVALVVGGIWTYMLFVQKRQKFPRARMAHQIWLLPLGSDHQVLTVRVRLSNVGDVLLSLESAEVRVQQLSPVPVDLVQAVRKGKDLTSPDDPEANWPEVGYREFTWESGSFEIEPKERDSVVMDFVVDQEIDAVRIYSYFRNVKKEGPDIGWGLTTQHDLPSRPLGKPEAVSDQRGASMSNKGRKDTTQQPPKKPPSKPKPPPTRRRTGTEERLGDQRKQQVPKPKPERGDKED